ncbi:MAG: hypothetical protein NTY68_02570 [Candidatus Micrarchaeota archaeon]|nr:hypothetical protein [Candidatus Micrarchaeota archaeon]
MGKKMLVNYIVWMLTILSCFVVSGFGVLFLSNPFVPGDLAAYVLMISVFCGWVLAVSYIHFVIDTKEEKVKCKR